MKNRELTYREKLILQYIIQNFVLTANPVGSRNLKKRYSIDLSPATIRNVMQDLEEMGYIEQPHTSAGRIPTDEGYRLYVDSLMRIEKITEKEKKYFRENLDEAHRRSEDLYDVVAKLLGKISSQLSVVLPPQLKSAILNRIELFRISSEKLLIALSLESGIVKTILMEMKINISDKEIGLTSAVLNERLAGLNLEEIKQTINQRMRDASEINSGLVRVFIDSANSIFDFNPENDLHFSGTKDIIKQPEFADADRIKTVIEFLENKNIIIHILNKRESDKGISVTIGRENEEKMAKSFTIITSNFFSGNLQGTLGVIGPTRMRYSKIISVINYTSNLLSEYLV